MFALTPAQILAALHSRFPELKLISGEDVFVVGGALRDLFFGTPPNDLDLTAVNGEAIATELARRTRRQVITLGTDRHASQRVVISGRIYDFTTILERSLLADLARRDFTMNAMAVPLTGDTLHDPFGGRAAIAERRISMVREQNLLDDPLRLLKAVRMAVLFDCRIDTATSGSIRKHASLITAAAPERLSFELDLILGSAAAARGVELIGELALDRPLFGRPIAAAAAEGISRCDDLLARWMLLLDDREQADVDRFAERMRWSVERRRNLSAARRLVDRLGSGDHPAIAAFDAGERAARCAACWLEAVGEAALAARLIEIRSDRPELFSTRALLGGEEIAALAGIEAGPRLGALKRQLLEAQLRGEVHDRAQAERFITTLAG
jgi:tRNA nucleotidyltransferase (CCA-adding enzyme)